MDSTSKVVKVQSIQQSLTNETKNKFDSILKVAMSKTLKGNPAAKSLGSEETQNLKHPTNPPNADMLREEGNVAPMPPICKESGDSIKPIPMPRNKKIKSQKLVHCSSNNSLCSQRTYVVENNSQEKIINPLNKDLLLINTKTSDEIESKTDTESVNNKSEISSAANNTYCVQTSDDEISIMFNSKQKLDSVKIAKTSTHNNQCEEKILEIIVHKADKLQLNSYVTHPAVKVHITDMKTGKYYPKSNKSRPVVFYYESEEQDYILPVLTSFYNLQEKRTFSPMWEESILLNEEFNYLANENVIIFFEVLDHVPFLSRNFHNLQKNCCDGWYRIAFAFLKPMGKNQFLNFNKKVRLQLYYEKQAKGHDPYKCDLWDLWKNNKLKKYPSTIYVTVKEVLTPKKVLETFRSKTPLQKENVSNKELNENKQKVNRKTSPVLPSYTKSFHLPNKCLTKLDSYDNGCFIFKFSNNGLYLACAVQVKEDFSIIIYSVKSFEEVQYFTICHGLIYNITWSQDDSLLITASANNTATVWNFTTHSFSQVLPHPNYVYACDISSENTIIATGCFDAIIRIWVYHEQTKKYELHQEIEKHVGFITSLVFNKSSTSLYSSDSLGYIFEWKKCNNNDWAFYSDLSVEELQNTVINQIMLFPNEKKILVHSRDSTLRVLSLKICCVLYRLQGALNIRTQTCCSISPCGNYVTSGSENGFVVVWSAITGRNIKTYDPFPNNSQSQTIHCVQFHPKNNIIALSHFGSNLPIMLYYYDSTDEKIMVKTEITPHDRIQTPPMSDRKHKEIDSITILQKIDEMLYKS